MNKCKISRNEISRFKLSRKLYEACSKISRIDIKMKGLVGPAWNAKHMPPFAVKT